MRCLWFSLCLIVQCGYADLSALYLTWYDDPCTTMTLQWHTPLDSPQDQVFLQGPDGNWQTLQGTSRPLENLRVYHLFLDRLTPHTEYAFRIGDDPTLYRFQTAPQTLTDPLRFVIGGDAYSSQKLFRKMNQTIVAQNPLFVVIGGDIAYAIQRPALNRASYALKRWLSFLSLWKEQMITTEGRLIPFLLVAGNHDLSPEQNELFFTLFAFPEKRLYRTLDFGSYLSLFFLDTGHLDPIEGEQTDWLKAHLSQKSSFAYRIAVYHEGAYPSFYPFLGDVPVAIRAHWCPLFDAYHLQAAFENHSHAYKKTYPIKANQIDPQGTIYFGDGCWGTPPRSPQSLWYLEKKMRKNHVFFLEMTSSACEVQALDLQGKVFDTFSLSPSLSDK